MALPNFDELWDYHQPDVTEQKFRALLPAAEADPDYHAQLLTQIARTQGLQRRFDEAHRTLDTVETMLNGGLSQRAHIRYLLERGRTFNSSQQRGRASELLRQAYELARSAIEDFYTVDAAHMLGISEPPDKQLAWSLKALEVAEQSADPRAQKWRGSLYNNIGWTYHDQGQYAKALELFERALAWREAQGQANEIRIAHWCVARAFRSLNRLEEALAIQRRLLAEHEQAGSSDGYVDEEIAECLLSLGRAAEAQPYFTLAYARLSQDPWLADQEPARLERLKTLGQVA
jgi:tetratricopeptide (TPR) repeat protein